MKEREWNLGYDIGLEAPEDLEQVANLQMICVHPKFRGNSLGRQMNSHAIEIIRQLRRYTHLCATVSPYNYRNIRTLLKSGFTIRTLKTKYNGKLRYVVYQNLTRAVEYLEKNERVSVRLTDVERQKELIHRGFMQTDLKSSFQHPPRLNFPLAGCRTSPPVNFRFLPLNRWSAASKTDRGDHCLMSKPMYGLTTDGLIYDAPCRVGRKTQQISEETSQPALNCACNPGDQRSKAFDWPWKYLDRDKFPGEITKKGTCCSQKFDPALSPVWAGWLTPATKFVDSIAARHRNYNNYNDIKDIIIFSRHSMINEGVFSRYLF